jgi:predicted nucleic acid-binding Zn ribbon protein
MEHVPLSILPLYPKDQLVVSPLDDPTRRTSSPSPFIEKVQPRRRVSPAVANKVPPAKNVHFSEDASMKGTNAHSVEKCAGNSKKERSQYHKSPSHKDTGHWLG